MSQQRGPAADGASAAATGLTLASVQADPDFTALIEAADRVMEGLGFTEHGLRHANLTARISYNVMSRMGFSDHDATLASVAGYLHDVGNMVSREMHGQTGALLVYHALEGQVPPEDLATVVAAVANHEEPHGASISPAAAAVILADKSDVHRTRVRRSELTERDIHDRVNLAAEQSFLRVDSDAKTVTLELTIDPEISTPMDYFEIFLGRMQMCRRAADTLGGRFRLTINGAALA